MVEDSTSEEVMLPPRDFMDAAEAVSWIGYGKALRKYYWGKHLFRLSRDWAFHDGIGIETEDPPRVSLFADRWFSSADELLSTFKARASGSIWPPYPRIKTEEGRKLAERYLAHFDISDAAEWAHLWQQLKADIQRRDPFLEKLRSAAGKLRRELYKGSLVAWGSKDADDPVNGPPRQKLLPDEWPPGVEINFDGHVREKDGWDWGIRWMLLSFDTEEVLAVWPPSLFQSETSTMLGDGPQSLLTSNRVLGWLLNFARSEMERVGAPPKRDETLKSCQNGTGCTYREARTAWDSLPADLKRKPRSTKPLIGTR